MFPLKPAKVPPAEWVEAARRRHEVRKRIHIRETISYNCAGLVFGARRGWLGDTDEPDSLDVFIRTALKEDGFRPILEGELLVAGDVVTYERNGDVVHVAVVAGYCHPIDNGEIMVLSKFGLFGEYLHPLADIPEECGAPAGYWKQGFE